MESQSLVFLSLISVLAAINTPTPYPTGPTFAPVPGCNTNTSILNDSSLCSGLSDGNYELRINGALFPMNFLSCVAGIPYCRFCPDPNGPLLYYTPACDQCLSFADFNASNCFTTEPTGTPLPPPNCPTNQTLNDAQCAEQGADFCGNRMDYRMPPDPRVFLMCYNGKYVDCMECQYGLQFIELRNFRNESDIYGHCA